MSHIDTYISPTSWDDLGMDWENPSAQKACYVDAIRLALCERGRVAGITAYWLLPPVSPDRLLDYDFLFSLDKAIKKFGTRSPISYFLDIDTPIKTKDIVHDGTTLTIGDATSYEQGGSIPEYQFPYNYMNLTSICQKLGVERLVSPQPNFKDNTEWLIQSYNILNLFKYTLHTFDEAPSTIQTRRRFLFSDDPEFDDPIDETTETEVASWNNGSANKSSYNSIYDGYYYYSGRSYKITTKFSFYYPSTWKLKGYTWTTGYFTPSTDFSNFCPAYSANPGYFYKELDFDFTTGFQVYEIEFGDTELLPKPPATEGHPGYYFAALSRLQTLIEHDFKFKSEEEA